VRTKAEKINEKAEKKQKERELLDV